VVKKLKEEIAQGTVIS